MDQLPLPTRLSAHPAHPGTMRLRRAVQLLLGLLAAWLVAAELKNTLLSGLPDLLVADGLIVAAQLAANTLVVLRALTTAGRERLGWLLLGSGLHVWWLGNLYWLLTGDAQVPVPSWGDAGFLGCLPLAFAGLAVLVRARLRDVPRGLWLDGLVAALAAAALSAALVLEPIAADAAGSPLQVATNRAYPVGDLALLAVIIGTIGLRGWRLDRTWALLGLAVLVFWGTDCLYLLATANGTYQIGVWFDLGWLCASLLIAAAAWLDPPHAREAPTAGGARLALMPALFAILSLGVLVTSGWTGRQHVTVALAAASLGALVLRLIDANRLNGALLEASRAEASSDALTGLGNRRALLHDLTHEISTATPQRPAHLALFDLGGFKAYNDSVGHPAGDALLTRLAHRLHQAACAPRRPSAPPRSRTTASAAKNCCAAPTRTSTTTRPPASASACP